MELPFAPIMGERWPTRKDCFPLPAAIAACAFLHGFLRDADIRIGVLPHSEEVLIGSASRRRVTTHGERPEDRRYRDYKASVETRRLLSGVAVTLTLVCVATSELIGRSGLSSWSNRVVIWVTVCAIGVRQTMAQRDPSSLASVPVILHYGGTVLSAAIAPALSSHPKIETER